jgi:hypothetical protein
MFRVGAARTPGDPRTALHSAGFAPDPEPTMRTAVRAMADLVLSLLAPPAA